MPTTAQLFLTRYDPLCNFWLAGLWALPPAVLRARPHPDLNSIAWNLWHLLRCEDAGLNRFVAGRPQVLDDRAPAPGGDGAAGDVAADGGAGDNRAGSNRAVGDGAAGDIAASGVAASGVAAGDGAASGVAASDIAASGAAASDVAAGGAAASSVAASGVAAGDGAAGGALRDWAARMNVPWRHQGGGMTLAEVDELDACIDLQGLHGYALAVSARTRAIVGRLDRIDLDATLPEPYLRQVLFAEGLAHPNAGGLLQNYAGWTKAQFLFNLGLTHPYQHVGEIGVLATLLGITFD